MREKRIIFGAGYLGTRISNELGYASFDRIGINPLNLDALKLFLDDKKPDIVINAIGKTGRPNIDWCEENKEETMLSNISAAINLSAECAKRGIYFVHLGSGCIYYGNNDGKGFSEEDEPNFFGPQFYAKTKIMAEKSLKELPGLILRLRMPIDNFPHERNLIDKLLKYPKVIDAKNSMTTVPHMIKAIEQLVEKRAQGIYNLVNPGSISAEVIMNLYREVVDPSHKFKVFSIKELDYVTKGKRSNCILSTDKLKKEGIILPEIHKAVNSCLLSYKNYLKNKRGQK